MTAAFHFLCILKINDGKEGSLIPTYQKKTLASVSMTTGVLVRTPTQLFSIVSSLSICAGLAERLDDVA